jgi:hypothetical protein
MKALLHAIQIQLKGILQIPIPPWYLWTATSYELGRDGHKRYFAKGFDLRISELLGGAWHFYSKDWLGRSIRPRVERKIRPKIQCQFEPVFRNAAHLQKVEEVLRSIAQAEEPLPYPSYNRESLLSIFHKLGIEDCDCVAG